MNDFRSPLRVAFVGAGQMARAHVRALRLAADRIDVVGAFDADPATAAAFAAETGTRRHASIADLLERTQPSVVHVCTPAGTHHDATRAALEFGAHVYVEKPFVETAAEADALLALAKRNERLVCAGHQLLADPACDALLRRIGELGSPVAVESRFSFASPTLRRSSTSEMRAAQLIDIVPHPLYALIAVLERLAPGAALSLESVHATPTSVDALLVAGTLRGRLCVDLLARPVGSTLSVTGFNGTLTADFIRGSVSGVANPGTSPLEKAANEVVNGALTAWRSGTGVVLRILRHGEYPGLVQLFNRFHQAIRAGGASPTSPEHLRRVAGMHEALAEHIRRSARAAAATTPRRRPAPGYEPGRPVAVVTGAGGFLGEHLVKALAARGFSVWGVGRGPDDGRLPVDRWIRADLSRNIPDGTFDGASVIVHAAAATSGGFDAHQRHSIDATVNVATAAARAGVKRVIHVSSLSVVAPPTAFFETQSERTPLASPVARTLGPYTWGKCIAEQRMVELCASAGIGVRVIRPGALFDPEAPEVPGLVGKRLFGEWHLALGRPSLPFAAIAVDDCARVIAWCAAEFESAPPLVNLFDPDLATRADVVDRLRSLGWKAKLVWFPVSLLAAIATSVRAAISLGKKPRPEPLAIWQVLRPRRFDPHLSSIVLREMRLARIAAPTETPGPLVAA